MANKNEYDGPPIRTGTWGPRKQECRVIENFNRPPGAQHGPHTIDYLPGDMYKIMHSTTECNQRVCDGHEFLRYADGAQIEEMANAITQHDYAKFHSLVFDTRAHVNNNGKPKRANGEIDKGWGGEDEVCKWIEAHDEVFVNYCGTDRVWTTGCWEVVPTRGQRQLLDIHQLYYVAQDILGMPKRSGMVPRIQRQHDVFAPGPGPEIEDLFGAPVDDLEALFSSPPEDDLEALFAAPVRSNTLKRTAETIARIVAQEGQQVKEKIGKRLRVDDYFESDPIEALFGAPPDEDETDLDTLFGGPT